MDLIRTCTEWCRQHPARVVFPDGQDTRAILAASSLLTQGLARPVLLGNPFGLRALSQHHGLLSGGVPIIDPACAPQLAHYADLFAAQLAEKKQPPMPREEILRHLADPLWFGAMMVASGDVDYCIGGNLSATSSVLRAALHVIGLAEGNNTVSSIFFMLDPERKRVLGFADCGVVPEPSPEQLADITLTTAASYRAVTGIEPAIALLSFSSGGSAKHPAVEKVRAAVKLVRQRDPQLRIDGELQFDAAYVPSVALLKVPDSPLAGQANVFIFPSLEAGNIGYKIAQRLGNYTALGPMLQGLRRPMHDLSRGCSVGDMIEASLIANKMATPIDRDNLVTASTQASLSRNENRPLYTASPFVSAPVPAMHSML